MSKLSQEHAIIVGRPRSSLWLTNKTYEIYDLIAGEPTMIATPFVRNTDLAVQIWVAPFGQNSNLSTAEFQYLYRHELTPGFFVLSPVTGMSGTHCQFTRDHGYIYTTANDNKAPMFIMFTQPSHLPLAIQVSYGPAHISKPFVIRLNVRVAPHDATGFSLAHARIQSRLLQVAFNIRYHVIWRVLPFQRGELAEYESTLSDPDAHHLDRFHRMATVLSRLNEQYLPWRTVKNSEIYLNGDKGLDPYLQDLMPLKPRATLYAAAYDMGVFDRDCIAKLFLCHGVHDAPDLPALDMINFSTFYCNHTFSSCRMRKSPQGYLVHEEHRKHDPPIWHPLLTSDDNTATLRHWYTDTKPSVSFQPDPLFGTSNLGIRTRAHDEDRPLPDEFPLTTWRKQLTRLHRLRDKSHDRRERMSPTHQSYWDLQQLRLNDRWVPYNPSQAPEPLRRDDLLYHLTASTNRVSPSDPEVISAINTFCFLAGRELMPPTPSPDATSTEPDANVTPPSQ